MAQAGLGHIYVTPFGVRGDRDKAEYWLQKAIDQGTETAQETRIPFVFCCNVLGRFLGQASGRKCS